MRLLNIKFFTLVNLFLLVFAIASAQRDPHNNPDYGVDSVSRISCANDLSTMSEFMKINLPDYALPSWRNVFENCPASSKNIYINGVKIFQYKIENAKDPALQSAYVDTLLLIYDKRIQYFGEEGYVLGRKGKDILRYRSQDYAKAYEALKQSFDASGLEVDPGVSVGMFETCVLLYKDGVIPAQELLGNYLAISNNTDKQLENGGRANVAEMVNTRINAALGKAGLNDCNDLEAAFRGKIDANSQDPAFLNLVAGLLQKSDCINTDFYGLVNEKLFEIEPKPDLAYTIAWYNIRKEKFALAISYLSKAIEIETDADKKSHYYYQMAILCNTRMNLQEDAVRYAEKAIDFLPAWGDPYFVIANAYIQSGKDCFEGAFERSAVYWVATDMCLKAKSVDNSVTEKANGYIADYARFYPNNEEAFFRSLQDGSPYNVACWINKQTTVRVKK